MLPSDNNIRSTGDLEGLLMDAMLQRVDPDQALLIKIRSCWPRVAGNLATHSMPVMIRGEQLVVRTEHSVYQQELRMHARTILGSLMRQIRNLTLKEIRIERGRVDWAEPDTEQMQHKKKPSLTSDTSREAQPASGDRLEDLL